MELRNCHKAEIFDLSDQLICEAEVTRASYEGYRLIVPREFELKEKTELYHVVFYDGVAGLIHTICVLGDALNISKEKQSVMCMVREERGNEQRRRDLKVPAEVGIEVSCVRRPAEPAAISTELTIEVSFAHPRADMKRLPARIPAKTRNISAGGVYFVCGCCLPVGAHVQFQLHEASRPLQLTAKILRTETFEPEGDGPVQYGHGCQFIQMKPNAEAELRSYIFRKELEQRKRGRER